MATFLVNTGLGSLSLDHSGGKVTASGGEGALARWQDVQLDGLYGAFGHILQPADCLASDLSIALITAFGRENVQWDDQCQTRIDEEMAGSIPQGAVP